VTGSSAKAGFRAGIMWSASRLAEVVPASSRHKCAFTAGAVHRPRARLVLRRREGPATRRRTIRREGGGPRHQVRRPAGSPRRPPLQSSGPRVGGRVTRRCVRPQPEQCRCLRPSSIPMPESYPALNGVGKGRIPPVHRPAPGRPLAAPRVEETDAPCLRKPGTTGRAEGSYGHRQVNGPAWRLGGARPRPRLAAR